MGFKHFVNRLLFARNMRRSEEEYVHERRFCKFT
jgi:hypothetical protein